jgi:flagellar protein FlaG
MSSDTFTTAIFLITAVVAAAVMVNAIFPLVYTMAGTFSSTTHASDERLRSDFKIVTTVATSGAPGTAKVWMKNIGSANIPVVEINRSDVFFGPVGNFGRLTHTIVAPPPDGYWRYDLSDLNTNSYWDPGETLQVTARTSTIPASGNPVYFQFVLSNSIWRDMQFTVS